MTRKIFGTDGIRGKANLYPMTPEVALSVGKAVAKIFGNGNNSRHKIVIGKDTRLSGYMIETALASGICSMGVDVYLVGPIPTPAIAHLTKSFNADAGIIISASHNPATDNGIKIFSQDGYKLPDEVEEKIENLVLSGIKSDHIEPENIGKAYRIDEAQGRYIEFAKTTIKNESLKGIKIVLDCANGAAYKVAPKIFSELGAEVIVIGDKPNGLNINLDCGALHPEKMIKKIEEEKADLGIALDGDADRVVMVDEKGEFFDGDHILAMCALDMKKEGKLKKDTVVSTVMSNLGFETSMKKAGIKVIKTAVGDRYVMEELKKGYSLGGEQSGHIMFTDHVTTGDGIISALQVLRLMKLSRKKLSELADCMQTYPQILVNIPVKEKRDFDKMPKVKQAIEEVNKKLGDRGRTLIRYSGTENLARIMIEGESKKEIEALAEKIAGEIRKEIGV